MKQDPSPHMPQLLYATVTDWYQQGNDVHRANKYNMLKNREIYLDSHFNQFTNTTKLC